MRVRIVSAMKGSLDGIDLSRFEAGVVYEVGTSIANYMMASGYAIPVVDERSDTVLPVGPSRDSATSPPAGKAGEKNRR